MEVNKELFLIIEKKHPHSTWSGVVGGTTTSYHVNDTLMKSLVHFGLMALEDKETDHAHD